MTFVNRDPPLSRRELINLRPVLASRTKVARFGPTFFFVQMRFSLSAIN